MEGGVIGCVDKIAAFSKTCFNTFLAYSKVSYLNQGTYGVALLLKIDHASRSPYIDIERKPVKTLIVKIGIVSSKRSKSNNSVIYTTPEEFRHEHKVQEAVFRKSLQAYDSALCPAVVHVESLSWDTLKRSYPKLARFMSPEPPGVVFTLLGMETFPDVQPFKGAPPLLAHCFYLLLRLGAIGYAHGDPSLSNVIVDARAQRPYLIDFGNPVKLSPKDTAFMRSQLTGVTDLRRVLKIVLKGFPQEFPHLPNWDWVKTIRVAPDLPKPLVLSKWSDKGWERVV